jgi:hypothetical protein
MNADTLMAQARTLLGDSTGIKFSQEQLEMGLQGVLCLLNARAPRTVILETAQPVLDQTLTLACSVSVRDVLEVACLDFYPVRRADFNYPQAGELQLRLTEPWPAGVVFHWRITLTADYQIEGLDGAVISTIPSSCALLLVYGLASRALQMRGAQLVESANNQASTTDAGKRTAGDFEVRFEQLLQAWQQSLPAPLPILAVDSKWQQV